ncbi:LptF/LptG family permease [Halanaerocella petrolearia]
MKIIDRYLAIEFIKPFLLTLFALVIILISSFLFQLTDFIIIKKIPVRIVIKLLVYRVPRIMVKSFSMAVLFATLLSLSRLVKDNEFTALQMGGVKFSRLLVPLLLLGLVISLMTYWFNESIVPRANNKYQQVIKESVQKKKATARHKDLFFKGPNNRYFYLGQVNDQTRKVNNILVYTKQTESQNLISAKTGSFKEETLYLETGIKHRLERSEYVTGESKLEKVSFKIKRRLKELYSRKKKPEELNRAQLKERIKLLADSGIDTKKLKVEYHFKLAQSLASLIFILIGAPLSIKSDKGRIFGLIASIVIIFAYYVFLSISRSLGRNGLLIPWLAAWLPNLSFVVLGSYLIIRQEYLPVT